MVGHAKRVALAVVLAVVTASVARADGPTKKERKRAAELIREARKAKQMGDRYAKRKKFRKRAMDRYKKAANAYIDAYAILQLDPIVFELAAVYDARGDKRWALRGYRRYLELAPEGDHAARAEQRVQELEEELDDGDDDGGDPDLDPTSVFGEEFVPEPEVEAEPDDDGTEPDEDEDGVPPTPEPEPAAAPIDDPEPPKPGRTLRWSGIGAAGVGVVFIGLGVKFGGDASSASDELSSKEGPWTDEDRQRIADGESAEKKAIAFTILGVAGVGAGAYLYYLGMQKDEQATKEDRVVVVPEVTPRGAGLTVMGRF